MGCGRCQAGSTTTTSTTLDIVSVGPEPDGRNHIATEERFPGARRCFDRKKARSEQPERVRARLHELKSRIILEQDREVPDHQTLIRISEHDKQRREYSDQSKPLGTTAEKGCEIEHRTGQWNELGWKPIACLEGQNAHWPLHSRTLAQHSAFRRAGAQAGLCVGQNQVFRLPPRRIR